MGFSLRELDAPAAPAGPRIEWEETDCLLCGSRHSSPLVEACDATAGGTGLWFVVVQCQDCGLCFTNPRPSLNTITQFYPPVYAPHRTPSLRHRPRLPARWLGSWRRRSERHFLPSHGLGRLLDFGCGGGSFLERMHRQGWQVAGVDMSAGAVHGIRAQLGLRALVGSLPHPELKPASFDVVTMWHSLEHVHYPLKVLREAHRLLVPGGKLLVAVPNIDSLAFRWFGSAWFGLDLPRHLTHFAPWTLHLMLERAGFRVEPIRMIRHSEWMRSSARRAVRTARGPHWHRWLTAKPASRLATWYSYLTQQADCILVLAER
jgi:SAM-dependent methyltransferase